MKNLLFILLVIPISLFAQKKDAFVLRNDSVFYNKVFQFKTEFRTASASPKTDSIKVPAKSMQSVSLKSPDGKVQAMLNIQEKDTTIKFMARFPIIGLAYECLYPKVELSTILESYVKNKVMVDGIATKDGVKAYCKERNIPIIDQEELKKQREAKNKERDSVLAIRTQEKMAKKFELTLKNNADSSVYIFIGDTTASKSSAKKPEALPFRQGRYELVNGKEEKSLTVFADEFLCISNSKHEILDFKKLDKTIIKLSVNKKGKKFE